MQRRDAIAVVEVAEQIVQRQVRLMDADRLVEPDPPRDDQAQDEADDDQAPEDQ